jgi:sortase (surface protein transpeptidase)
VIGPGRRGLAVAVAGLALLVGCSGSGARQATPSTSAAAQPPDRAGSGLAAARGFQPVRNYQTTPVPVRLEIPSIHVASSLARLGRAADGTIQVPGRWEVAGWYALGPRPGDPGSAVILGHVDSKHGPAVFYRLRELGKGDQIDITRADGSSVRFVVQRTAQYLKTRFPTEEVYYPTLAPALRLVTCGGQFDFTTRHYRSNIIVFATIQTPSVARSGKVMPP